MKAFRALTVAGVTAMHEELIARYGGSAGVRDSGLLASAIARPLHLATYKKNITVPELAAGYGWGLIRNHPFIDGNKRIGLASVVVALEMNKWKLSSSEVEETAMVLRAAANEISEAEWVAWVKKSSRRKPVSR
jgi:death-on-curing protein